MRRIDVHHHIFSPKYLARRRDDILRASANKPWLVVDWTPQASIEQMDRYAITTAITSVSAPGVWFGDVDEGRALARLSNEYAADLIRDFPGRFASFACLPLPDADGSIREAEYALDTLGAVGVAVLTSYEKRWLGDERFDPIFRYLNGRGAAVFVHPTIASDWPMVPGISPALLEYPTDTARTILSLMVSGTFSRYRNLRFIFVHAGGTIGILAGRVRGNSFRGKFEKGAPKGIDAVFQRLYFDITYSVNPSTIAALRGLVPDSQLLFGADYPYVEMGETVDALDRFGLPAETTRAINYENALKLFPGLNRT